MARIGIHPSLGTLTLEEAAWMLQGVYLANLAQLQNGQRGILGALVPGSAGPGRRALRYIRGDPREHWRTIREIWIAGGGDCEDLACGAAAELTALGFPAQPVIYRVRPGLAHAVVRIPGGRILDPSKLGGMGETKAGGLQYSPLYAALELAP